MLLFKNKTVYCDIASFCPLIAKLFKNVTQKLTLISIYLKLLSSINS